MVASRCAYENTSFVKFENREHFYPTVKDFTVPIEMFFKKDELSHVVAFFYAYFQRDSRIHTKDTYMDFIVSKINQIIYFLNYRTKRNTRGIASVVLCVKDKEELDFVVNALSNSNDLEVALPNIYITSESILNKKLKLEQSFITLEREADGEIYYSSRKPLFID